MTAVAKRIYLFATCAVLLVSPFAASSAQRNAWMAISLVSLAWLLARREIVPPAPAPRALFAALAAWCVLSIASLAWSIDPAFTLNELRAEVFWGPLAFAIFLCGAGEASSWRAWWMTLLAGALLVAGAECLRVAFEPALGTRAWDGGGGAFSTHLVIVAPLLLALAWPRPWGAGLGIVALCSGLALLFLAAWDTGNRMVWVALLASFVTALLARRLAGSEFTMGLDTTARRGVAIAGLAAIVALSLATAWHRGAPVEGAGERIATSLKADLRPALWSVALQEIGKAPWLGHGFGRDIAAKATRVLNTPGDGQPELRHGHNRFLNVALQLGLVGLAVFTALLVLLAREFLASLRNVRSAPAGILGLAILAGFIVKNLTDDFMHRHNAIIFWAVMAALVGLGRARRSAP